MVDETEIVYTTILLCSMYYVYSTPGVFQRWQLAYMFNLEKTTCPRVWFSDYDSGSLKSENSPIGKWENLEKAESLLPKALSETRSLSLNDIGDAYSHITHGTLVPSRHRPCQLLTNNGYSYSMKKRDLCLTQRQKEYRIKFVEVMLRQDSTLLDRLVFSDETPILAGDLSKKAWQHPDAPVFMDRPVVFMDDGAPGHRAKDTMQWWLARGDLAVLRSLQAEEDGPFLR